MTYLHLLIFALKKPGRTHKKQCSMGPGGEGEDKVIVRCENFQFINFYFLIFALCECITCLKKLK